VPPSHCHSQNSADKLRRECVCTKFTTIFQFFLTHSFKHTQHPQYLSPRHKNSIILNPMICSFERYHAATATLQPARTSSAWMCVHKNYHNFPLFLTHIFIHTQHPQYLSPHDDSSIILNPMICSFQRYHPATATPQTRTHQLRVDASPQNPPLFSNFFDTQL
jgi:hypothetical protein